jgi:oligopeptide transport system permease protein
MTRSAEAVLGGEEDVRRPPDAIEIEEGASLWRDAWYRLKRNRLAVISLFIFIAIVLFCVVGPFLSPWDSEEQDLLRGAGGPSAAHWFGTDTLGRDLMVRTMEGGRISLLVGLVATVVALLIGVIYGATAGYVGGGSTPR